MNIMRAWLVLGLCGSTGCGDPLVGADYRGETLFLFQGAITEIFASASTHARADEVTLTLLWARDSGDTDGGVTTTSVQEQRVASAQSIMRYELAVHTPPPESLLRRPRGGEGLVVVGLIAAYIDENDDGRWDPQHDTLAGGVPQWVVLYTPKGASGGMLQAPLAPGFHALRASECGGEPWVRRLSVPGPEDEPDLVINLDLQASLYMDLDCNGDTTEWIAPTCPPIYELEQLCVGEEAANPDSICNYCAAAPLYYDCEVELALCVPEHPIELCDSYQQCLDPTWQPDPYMVCDATHQQCLSQFPNESWSCNDELNVCYHNVSCEVGDIYCRNESGASSETCDLEFQECLEMLINAAPAPS